MVSADDGGEKYDEEGSVLVLLGDDPDEMLESSDRAALGRRMLPSLGGDCESRESGNVPTFGELKLVGGAEPFEYTDTEDKCSALAGRRRGRK